MDARPNAAFEQQLTVAEMRSATGRLAAQDGVAADEIDLGRLFGLIWQGKLWIVFGVILGFAVAAFSYANTAPTFQADALVQLEEKSAAMMLPGSLSAMMDKDPRSVTEVEILRSRMVLGRAVADQNLDWVVRPDLVPLLGTMLSRYALRPVQGVFPQRFARHGEYLRLQNLVVPPEWLNRDLRVTVTDAGGFEVQLPNGDMLSGQVGEALTLDEPGFTLTIADIAANSGRVYFLRQISEDAAIEALRLQLTVSERGRGSGILELRLTGPDMARNARALDAILRAYQLQNINRSAAQAEGSLDFIRDQIPLAEQALRQAETALNQFQMQQVSVDLRLETQTILDEVTRVEAQLADLQRREDELSLRFTPLHPNYRLLLDERARLQTRLEGLREQIGELPETQRQIINLQRDVDLAQRLYLELLTRAQEVEVMRASTIGSVRIVDSAIAARAPIAPRRNLILALGAVLGFVMSLALVLIRSWLRKGIQDGADLERMGLPLFATVNYNREADTQGRRAGALPLLALTNPTDLTIEALRSLRTSLHFGMLDAGTPTLTLTSTHPGAGKSFLSVNLAVVAAQAGQRVCLIDADMRRGQLRRYLNQPRNHPGLAEVLAGTKRPEDVIMQGPVNEMFFIGTGRYPPNPSELLMRAELSDLFQWCSEHFDLVILDTPPVLAVTDPVILGRKSGATILVARHDRTLPGEIEAALKIFQSSGQRLAGAVLNGFDPSRAKGGYGYGYGYRYSYQQRSD